MRDRIIFYCLFWFLAGIGGIPCAAWADNDSPRPRVDVPHAGKTPLVDASPVDPAWESAATIPSLSLSLTKDAKKPATVPTQVKLLWDERWLYVRFVCVSDEIYSPFTQHGDPLYQGDVVEVFLDPKGDGRHWLEVEVSPNNVTMEVITTLTTEPRWNSDLILVPEILAKDFWPNLEYKLKDMRTAASVQREGDKVTGWTVDIALPAKTILHRLGVSQYSPMTMRANFMRYEWPRPADAAAKRSLTAMNWSPVLYGQPHICPAAMGFVNLVGGSSKK